MQYYAYYYGFLFFRKTNHFRLFLGYACCDLLIFLFPFVLQDLISRDFLLAGFKELCYPDKAD